jgi:hypothetical protein
MNIGGVSFHRPRPASRLIHAEGYAASLMPPIHNLGLYLGDWRYCQELWIGGAWLGGFLPIFLVFTAFDLNTINERNTSTHQG